jgi:hypothetical protein
MQQLRKIGISTNEIATQQGELHSPLSAGNEPTSYYSVEKTFSQARAAATKGTPQEKDCFKGAEQSTSPPAWRTKSKQSQPISPTQDTAKGSRKLFAG